MPVISSSQNPTIKLVRSLAEKKYREQYGLFVAEGEKVLERARETGWVPDTLLSVGPAKPWGESTILEVTREVMASVSAQKNPPPLIATFHPKWLPKAEATGLWLALEDIRDPGNLGTIIRTADAAGARGIILAGSSCDPWSPDCVRATMGSIFAVPLHRMGTSDLIALIKSWPGETVGTHLQATEDYRRPYQSPTLLIMGSEGQGLSDRVAEACATLVRIPMKSGPESLNLAVASGLVLFEAAFPRN